MMFNPKGEEQVCNNFARKSVRGFFHDFMSSAIDGSILSETTIQINFGLCRWAQYINVLADETTCDPGSIIAMAGELGYDACGVKTWEFDHNTKPGVTIGRPHPCGQSLNDEMFETEGKFEKFPQRYFRFSDTQAAANSTAMEEFWYTLNSHTHARPDGEAEYSGEASAHAHAIGRVTCQPDGVDETGSPIDFKLGFFHKPRSAGLSVDDQFTEALDKIRQTQCNEVAGEKSPTGGLRLNTDVWPLADGETDMNPEGGLCGMPTQFLGTVHAGGRHRTPRWISITEHSAKHWPAWSAFQRRDGGCTQNFKLFIPHELLTIDTVEMPTSDALDRFHTIAWDGHDRIDSAWDSCELECMNPVLENRMCSADSAAWTTPQLRHFDWTKGWCDTETGVLSGDGSVCCAKSCGDKCRYDGGACADRTGGAAECCPSTIKAAAAECISYRDTGCVVPRMGDGGLCAANDECASSLCLGGRCCGPYGQTEGCAECDVSGNCAVCASETHTESREAAVGGGVCNDCSFELNGPECASTCQCREGCAKCDCGECVKCAPAYYLDAGVCHIKRGDGAHCSADEHCKKNRCTGGNCCDVDVLKPGCVDCNFRGLCDACDEAGGFTLCGHHSDGSGYGQCNATIAGDRTTQFTCGTGGHGVGDHEDHVHSFSSDGANYCSGIDCPCDAGGVGD